MTLEITAAENRPADADLTGLTFFKDREPDVDHDLTIDLGYLENRGFEGKAGQTQSINVDGAAVLAIGLGDRAEVTADSYRRAAAQLARAASKNVSASLISGGDSQAVAEGVVLGSYKFTNHKSKPEPSKLERVRIVGGEQTWIDRGVTIANAVCLARDLINEPAAVMTPRRLAEVANEVASEGTLRAEIWDDWRIESENLGGLLGVAKGSAEPPRLIQLFYEPEGATRSIAIVGKGITFDSGGLSIKPADGMMTMKTDMSGAAAVIAAMSVLPSLAPNVRVVGIAAATENVIGPNATKPGDVLTARNGKTMEVLNTDAEGRLVLSDALSLAVEADVDAIVDVATLTGACKVALGSEIAGLFSNDDELCGRVQEAADRAGEPVWHLPLPKQYRKQIDSEIADIKNIGSPGGAGASTAGLFLQEFVGDTPWAHLDIAGPARSDADDGYMSKGGAGFGVRTLIELIRGFDAESD